VRERAGAVTHTLKDDGEGFDTEARHSGFGLVGMRERVELVGGTLEIQSDPGTGTRITATLPARHGGASDDSAHESTADVRAESA